MLEEPYYFTTTAVDENAPSIFLILYHLRFAKGPGSCRIFAFTATATKQRLSPGSCKRQITCRRPFRATGLTASCRFALT